MTHDVRPQSSGDTLVAAPLDGIAPEQAAVESAAARVFYALDSRRVRLREQWRSSPSSILSLALFKLFRVRLPSSVDDPTVETLAPFEVEASEVPGTVVQRSSVAMHQLASLGFRNPIWHVIEDDVSQTKTYLASLSHDSGRVWARVHHRIWHVRTPATTTMFTEFVTELVDGSFHWSVSSKADLDAPDSCTVIREAGAPPGRLMAAHQQATGRIDAKRVRSIAGPDELREAVERHHASVRDHRLERGVFVPVTADERRDAVTFRARVKSAETAGSRYPEILAEVDRLQRAKASRANGVMLLIASLVLFVGAGVTDAEGSRFSAGTLAIIVAVLFVHELGHWVAMQTFGYRNLKMFFIPFLGAAVSGRHYNVPGWKKAVVSLMGPLPGILIGAGLGWLGVTLHQPLLIKISLVALLLNGFNLLPILPLDGGWIVQAILFSRHHLLELAFRIAALAALALMAVYSSDNVLIGVSVVMAVSLPAMFKLARITNELRRARLPAGSEDGQTLPQETADVIVGKIKAVFPAKLSNKNAARYTLQIFENLNARPPGVLASIGLGMLQFGSIAAVVFSAMLIFVGSRAGVSHDVAASSIAVVQTPGDSALAMPRNLIVADFAKPEKVAAAAAAAQRAGPPDMAIERFGQTLLVALPFEDVSGLREMQTVLERQGATSYVAAPGDQARMRLSCTATSARVAVALERELGGYLVVGGLNLLPPWQPGVTWTSGERASYGKARETFRSLENALTRINRDPAILALEEQIMTAGIARNGGKLQLLQTQRAELVGRLRAERTEALQRDPAMDSTVIDSVAAIGIPTDSGEAVARGAATVAPLLGQLPLVDGHPAPGTDQWSVAGNVRANGVKLSLWLRFTNAFQGAPAVVRWLSANGCGDVKYTLVPVAVRKTGAADEEAGGVP